MPERRIDAIGKADAASWNAVHLPKGSPNLLRIISGQLSRMPVGEVMSAVVEKAARGAFKISLNGEAFIIKGLPPSLLGKAVSFVARQTPSTGKSGVELFWLGQSRQTVASNTTKTTAQQTRLSAQILSVLPAALIDHAKSGNVVNGRVDSIQAGKMTMNITLADLKNSAKNINHQIQTSVIHDLKQGQHFSARIQVGVNQASMNQTGMSNKAVLEILTQAQTSPTDVKSTASKPPVALPMASFPMAEGNVISAMVQKRLPNGHIQLSIQGVSVETPAPKSIAQGDLLVLRMNKAPAEFQLISVHKNAAEKAMAVVKNNLPVSHEPLAQSMAAMRNVLPPLAAANIQGITQLGAWFTASAAAQAQPASGEQLARMIRDSGAELETKLLSLSQKNAANTAPKATIPHDLKAIMLQLAQAQTSNINQAGIIKILAELGQHSTARIETNQALNVLAQVHGDPIRYELPMLVGQQLVNIQMSFQKQYQYTSGDPEQGGASDQAYNVLFALELSGLGKMRVDASISDTSVHARIYSDQSGVGHFIRDHMQRLETRLHDLGYKEVYLLAAQSPPDAQKQRRFDQLTQMAPAVSLSLLDVIA